MTVQIQVHGQRLTRWKVIDSEAFAIFVLPDGTEVALRATSGRL